MDRAEQDFKDFLSETSDNEQQFTQAALADTADSLGLADVADTELGRFCAELGRELEMIQRERAAIGKEIDELRFDLRLRERDGLKVVEALRGFRRVEESSEQAVKRLVEENRRMRDALVWIVNSEIASVGIQSLAKNALADRE